MHMDDFIFNGKPHDLFKALEYLYIYLPNKITQGTEDWVIFWLMKIASVQTK